MKRQRVVLEYQADVALVGADIAHVATRDLDRALVCATEVIECCDRPT